MGFMDGEVLVVVFRLMLGFVLVFASMTLTSVALTTGMALTASMTTTRSAAHYIPVTDRTGNLGRTLVNDDLSTFDDLAAIWWWRWALDLIDAF